MLNMPSETKGLRRRGTALGSEAVASASPPLAARATGAPAEWRGWSPARSPVARPGPAVTLALIGGQRLLREATASLLTAQDGLNVLGTFDSPEQFLGAEWKSPP